LTQDIAGESRFQEAQVDIGAYETPSIAATVLSVSPDTCSSAANGALDLDITSFCPPLIYAWADQTNTAAAQLPAGSYPLSITDAAQRTLVLDITIPDTLRLQLSSNVLVPDCTLSQTGSIEILVSEGLAPYQYLWSDNNMQSVRNDILGGEYTITVSNDFGCRDSLLFNIAPEGELSVSSFSTPITCHDTQDGIIDVDVMGGFEDLNFIWQDGDTSQNQINLSAGSYTVSVTDNYGCAGEDTTNLMSPEPILIDFIITNSTSSTAGDGQIEITSITGGLAPYTLLWNTGDQDSILENISFGNYSLSILDERGCQKNFDFYVDFNSRLNTLNNTKKLLFPNPVERGQKVKVLLPDFSPITYQWIDGQGRLTKKGKIATNQSQFITPNVAGIYLLKLNDEMRKIVCMKVVVF